MLSLLCCVLFAAIRALLGSLIREWLILARSLRDDPSGICVAVSPMAVFRLQKLLWLITSFPLTMEVTAAVFDLMDGRNKGA